MRSALFFLVGLAVAIAELPCDASCEANNECSPTDPPDHTKCPRCSLDSNTCTPGFGCGCRCSVNTDCQQEDQNSTCSKCYDVDPFTRVGICLNPHCNYGCDTDADCEALTFGSCPVCNETSPGVRMCRPRVPMPEPQNCGGPPPPPPPPSHCSWNLDNIFLMDGSGSISSKSWRIERQVVLRVGQNFTFGRDKNSSMMGIIQFSSTAHLYQPLTSSANEFFQTLSTMPHLGGATNTAAALLKADEEFTKHGRPGGYRSVVLITDGKPNRGSPLAFANRLKKKGVKIFAVAVGKWDSKEISECCSTPVENYFYTVPTWDALPPTIHGLVDKMCNRTGVDKAV